MTVLTFRDVSKFASVNPAIDDFFFLSQSPKVIYWHDANTCKGKVPVDQLLLSNSTQCEKHRFVQSKDSHGNLCTPETISEKTQTVHAQLKNHP